MFREYTGEFLVHPAAVELNGDYCSHSCFYCFANLNAPNHKADRKAIANFLANLNENNDNVSILLRQKFPVFVSNHVDLFSTSNRWLVDIVRFLTEAQIPVFYQTRFSNDDKLFDYVKSLQKACWQVTIETHSDEISKKISPGAAVISKRLKNIETLIKENHLVVANILPFSTHFFDHSNWKTNFKQMLDLLYNIGVKGIWFNPLHLTTNQKRRIKKYPKDVFPEQEFNKAHKVDFPLIDCYEILLNSKLNFHCPYFPCGYDIFEGIDKIYENYMPTIHPYWHGMLEGDILICEEFLSLYRHKFPKGVFNLRNYLISNGYDETLKRFNLPVNFTYEDLTKILWGFGSVYNPHDDYAVGLNRFFLHLTPIYDSEKKELVVDELGCIVYACNIDNELLHL